MKKIIIFIFLIGTFINQSYAQKGISTQYINTRSYVLLYQGTTIENGLSLGYFTYKNDFQFKQYSLSVTSGTSSVVNKNEDMGYNFADVSYTYKFKSYTFSYEKYTMFGKGEMGDINQWYWYRAWDFSYFDQKLDVVSGRPDYKSDLEDSILFKLSVGLRLGIGYQRNFSNRVGVFGNAGLGIQYPRGGASTTLNLGTRITL